MICSKNSKTIQKFILKMLDGEFLKTNNINHLLTIQITLDPTLGFNNKMQANPHMDPHKDLTISPSNIRDKLRPKISHREMMKT